MGKKPWVMLILLVLLLLGLSIGFLVIALQNPPTPHASPDDDLTEPQVSHDVPGSQSA